MKDANDQSLREQLIDFLSGGGAHAKFDDVVKGLPLNLHGTRPAKFPHSPWMLLEHLRLAQWDILEFSRNSKYVSPEWPAGYWPRTEAPPNSAAWNRSIEEFRRDLEAMQNLVANPKTDFVGAHRLGRRPDYSARDSAARGPQRLTIWDSS